MKYIKSYESLALKEGEYVVIKSKSGIDDGLCIGRIYSLYDLFKGKNDKNGYFVKYTLPDNHTFNDFFKPSEIVAHSQNIKELELYINSNKYNI